VVNGDRRVLDLITETINWDKKVDGHSSGARGNKLQAYISSGVSSCHEPISTEEVRERLRLGLFVLIREGEIRRDLKAISPIKDENIALTRLAISTDGLGPWQLVSDGYMEFVVQKTINLGFSPVQAIQMATINVVISSRQLPTWAAISLIYVLLCLFSLARLYPSFEYANTVC